VRFPPAELRALDAYVARAARRRPADAAALTRSAVIRAAVRALLRAGGAELLPAQETAE
jgi:hypothetical protein